MPKLASWSHPSGEVDSTKFALAEMLTPYVDQIGSGIYTSDDMKVGIEDPKEDPKKDPKVDPQVDPKEDPKVDPKVDPLLNPNPLPSTRRWTSVFSISIALVTVGKASDLSFKS